MITLKNINLSSIDLSGIDLRGIKLGLGGRGGGSGDGFPQLPGDVTRWHFGGLTNEMMAAMDDPRIEDADHKGRFLSFKNFAWGGMSGVGGYVQNFNYFRNNATVDKVRIDEQSSNSIKVTPLTSGMSHVIYIPKDVYQFNKSYFIKISSEGYNEGDLFLSFYAPSTSTATTVKVPLNPNGITEIPAIKEDDFLAVYLFNAVGKVGSITIEQLPLYPGFILGDGVDDFAVTEKELNFEDTYTVYTAFIPFQNNPTRNMILCGADSKKTFSMQYSSLVYVSFIAGNNYYINADFVNGLNLFACKRNGNNICIKNLLTNKVVTGTCGDWVENAGLYYLWKNAIYASFARTAIAGQTICNGYFSTDEDDEKVLNWYKKQYPWLFPDQAWTVVGKTNEDKDRATIANITGNGNNLVLSNFGFAEGSGYGLYKQNFSKIQWISPSERVEVTKTNSSFNITEVKKITIQLYYLSNINEVAFTVPSIKVRVVGLTDGQSVNYRYFVDGVVNYFLISSDGIYDLPAFEFPAKGDYYGFEFTKIQSSCNITIEQIPEYEGYLVTDGVDDEVRSAAFTLNKDWTIVGNWEFITNENKNAGLTKVYSFYLYNRDYGIFVYKYTNAGQGFSVEDVKSLKAICSDGRIYLNDWQEIRNNIEQEATISKGVMAIGYFNRDFTKMAFKNLGIYNDQLLSKDDCIKAYNYLQTLKAK
jgi:hypothetical protein